MLVPSTYDFTLPTALATGPAGCPAADNYDLDFSSVTFTETPSDPTLTSFLFEDLPTATIDPSVIILVLLARVDSTLV